MSILALSCGSGDGTSDQASEPEDTVEDATGPSDSTDTTQAIVDISIVETDNGSITRSDIPQCNTDNECDDGLFCNGVEECRPGFPGTDALGCRAGEIPTGFDPDPTDCTVLGACDEETDSFPLVTLGEGDPCTDGIACTENDSCQSDGTCAGLPTDTLCNDGLFCNGEEACSTVIGCVLGVPPTGNDPTEGDCLVVGPCEEATDSFALIPADTGIACNDGVECTVDDSCTAAGTCEGTPDHDACSDGQFCNGPEQCTLNSGCEASTGPATPPEDSTPNDCFAPTSCNEETDSFEEVPLATGALCDDGVACTTGDSCTDEQACIGTADHTICDDGLFCNGPETCDTVDGCIPGTPPSPPIDEQPADCVVYGSCSEMLNGFAYNVLLADGTTCDDGLECTVADSCAPDGTCIGTPDDTECDDSIFCNGNETCDATSGCVTGSLPTAPEDTDPTDCVAPLCDETTQTFVDGPLPSGTVCNDGVDCTIDDLCNDSSVCAGTPDDNECDDGTFCNGAESCDLTVGCQPGQPPSPTTENTNECLVAFCDETTKIVIWDAAVIGTTCDDGILCTGADQCDGAGACAGTPDNSLCDDGAFCNGVEVCTAGVGCEDGPDPTPIDADPSDCEQPSCNEATDEIITEALPDGTGCNDNDSLTENDICTSGVCAGVLP